MTRDTFMGRSIYPSGSRSKVPLGAKIYPVRPGKLRLQSGAYKEVVESFRSLLSVPSDLFDQFYHQLLVRYADFVQLIPEQESLPSHSMLGNALKRTYTVLKTIIPLLQAREGKRFFQTSKGARLLYAIFSAMLLFRVAKLFADKHIVLCNDKGQFLANWRYFDQPMTKSGRYFKMRSGDCMPAPVIADMTIVLAKQMMPELGFAWLAEDKVLLGQWFKALNIYDELFGVHDISLDVDALMHASHLHFEHEVDFTISDATLLGEAFWEWLCEHVSKQSDSLSLESDGIGLVDGELLFDVDRLVEAYAKERQVQAQQVYDQLAHLGISQVTGDDLVFRQLVAAQSHSGVVSSGLYAQKPHLDALDAKRFVGIDSVLASACIKNYNGLSAHDHLALDREQDGIFGRLVSMFVSRLSGGLDIDLTSGRK